MLNSESTSIRSYLYGSLLFFCLALVGSAQPYSKDANGWSIITASSDSRLIYISATGNDSTARPYAPSEVGSDPRNPTGSILAYQTLAAAKAQMRGGFPDWLLIRRGDTFTESVTFGGNSDGGRNASQRHVYTYYGASGNRPLLTAANWDYTGPAAHIAVVGLEMHYRRRDPTSPFWVNYSAEHKLIFRAILHDSPGNVLLEDCIFRNGVDNIAFQGIDIGTRIPNVEVRRCAVWDANNGLGADAHQDRSQGIYGSWMQNAVIEDCFFDHNGWNQNTNGSLAGNGRSIFSHNVYLANGSRNTAVLSNLITRAAANGLQARAGNFIDDNLFILNPIGLFSASTTVEGEDPTNDVTDNVVIAGDDILPSVWTGGDVGNRGWGIEVHRTPEGLYQGNIILDEAGAGTGTWAMDLNAGTGSQQIRIWNNIIRNWKRSDGVAIQEEDPASYNLSNNIVDGINLSTGQPVSFVDGNRTLSTYLSSIGLSGNNLTFITNARAAWVGAPRSFPANYRASTVNNYFRAGFTISGGTRTATIAANDASAGEPSNNGQFTVTVNPAPTSNMTVNLTRSGTATNATDYANIPTTVTVGTSGTATINVTVTDDTAAEVSETVILGLVSGTGYAVGSPSTATVTIADNDSGTRTATITANDASAGEPANNGQFTVTVSPVPTSNMTVNLTRSGTATNATDYANIPTTVTVGTSGTATINVTVTDDSTAEASETVILTLASGTGYTVGSPNSATVTIADNDSGGGGPIGNSGFEAPTTANYVYTPSGGTWTFAGNSGIQRNGSDFGAANAPEGVQTAFLQGNPSQGALGSISQLVNVTSAGTYTVAFQAARRAGQSQPIRVRVDGTQIGSLLTPAGDSFALLTSASFTLTAGSHTIALEATNNTGDNTTFVDAVTLTGGSGGASYKINFQPAASAVPAGYVADSGATYGARNGLTYGWNVNMSANSRDRGIDPDQRLDTLIFCNDTTQVWELAVPNGTYTYTIVCGDPQYTDHINNIQIESTVRNDPDGNDNFDTFTGSITVSDGRLTLRMAAGGVTARPCYIDLQ